MAKGKRRNTEGRRVTRLKRGMQEKVQQIAEEAQDAVEQYRAALQYSTERVKQLKKHRQILAVYAGSVTGILITIGVYYALRFF